MAKLIRRMTVLVKDEAIYNTDSLPVPALDAVRVMDVSYGLTGQRVTERNEVHASLAKLSQIIGDSLFTLTCKIYINGSGTAGTAPRWGALLRCCAITETVVAVTSVAYSPESDSSLHGSSTVYIYEDGLRYIMTGVRGTPKLDAKAGEPGMIEFNLTGHFSGPTDQTLVNPTLETALAPVVRSAGFTVGGYAAVVSGVSFDIQNEVITPDDINSADSYGEIIIAGRNVTGTIDPEVDAVATKDFLTEYRGGASYPLATGVIGLVAGNRWQLVQPAIQYSDWAIGDKSGIRTNDMPYMAVESVGDDDFTLTLT